jgi:hypothetical protein
MLGVLFDLKLHSFTGHGNAFKVKLTRASTKDIGGYITTNRGSHWLGSRLRLQGRDWKKCREEKNDYTLNKIETK